MQRSDTSAERLATRSGSVTESDFDELENKEDRSAFDRVTALMQGRARGAASGKEKAKSKLKAAPVEAKGGKGTAEGPADSAESKRTRSDDGVERSNTPDEAKRPLKRSSAFHDDKFETAIATAAKKVVLEEEEGKLGGDYEEVADYGRRNRRNLIDMFPALAWRLEEGEERQLYRRKGARDAYAQALEAVCLFRYSDDAGDAKLPELLSYAFHAEVRDLDNGKARFQDDALCVELLERELYSMTLAVATDPRRTVEAFGSREDHHNFHQKMRRELRMRFTAEIVARRQRLHEEEQARQQPKGCCGGLFSKNKRSKAQREQEAADVKAKALERVEEIVQRADAKIEAWQEGKAAELDPPSDYHASFRLLLWVITQHESSSQAEECAVALHRPVLRETGAELKPLSAAARAVLRRYGTRFAIGVVEQELEYMQLLIWNRAVDASYWEAVYDQVLALDKLRETEPWTQVERVVFWDLCLAAYEWTLQCLSQYPVVFFKARDALTSCLTLCEELSSVLTLLEPIMKRPVSMNIGELRLQGALPKFPELLSETLKEAHKYQYQRLLASVGAGGNAGAGSKGSSAAAASAASVIAGPAAHNQPQPSSSSSSPPPPPPPPPQQQQQQQSQPQQHANKKRMDDANPCAVQEAAQLLQLFRSVQEEVRADEDRDDCFSAVVPDMSLSALSAGSYAALLWGDAQMFLRVTEQRMPQDSGLSLFKLYPAMRDFHSAMSEYIDMPEQSLRPLFAWMMNRWIADLQAKFGTEWVKKMVAQDEFKQLNLRDDHFSVSVVDLFALLQKISQRFGELPFLPEHVKAFAGLISTAVNSYVELVAKTIGRDLDAEDKKPKAMWGYKEVNGALHVSLPYSLTVRLNNIYICKTKLLELLRIAKLPSILKRAASTDALLRGRSGGSKGGAAVGGGGHPASDDDEDLDDSPDSQLLSCSETFVNITRTLDRLFERIAGGMAGWVHRVVHYRISEDTSDKLMTRDEVEQALDPMLHYLQDQLDNFTDRGTGEDLSDPDLYDEPFFRFALMLFGQVVEVFERELIGTHRKHHTQLSDAQIHRVHLGVDLTQEFFYNEYQVDQKRMRGDRSYARVMYITQALRKPTSELVELFEVFFGSLSKSELEARNSLPVDKLEEVRKAGEPYLHPFHFFRVLEHRAKKFKDAAAEDWVKKHRDGWLKRITGRGIFS